MLKNNKIFTAIGLMSGTSMDGIDASIVKSNGFAIDEVGDFITIPYDQSFKAKLQELVELKQSAPKSLIAETESKLTMLHADIVRQLLAKSSYKAEDIDVIGFHGHTIDHQPNKKYTWQIGDSEQLARLTGISVIGNLRYNDVKLGGQGAPLLPLYHKAIIPSQYLPAIVLNIGGVANITYIGKNNELIAFDTGPGNALIDDYVRDLYNQEYDKNGDIASSGKVDKALLDTLLSNIYFYQNYPKSLDRNHFKSFVDEVYKTYVSSQDISNEDLIATLSEFTARSVNISLKQLPELPQNIFICGGGAKNKYITSRISKITKCNIYNIDYLDKRLNVDAIESQGFAYLAIRSILGQPITYSTTTGVKKTSVTGGVFYPA